MAIDIIAQSPYSTNTSIQRHITCMSCLQYINNALRRPQVADHRSAAKHPIARIANINKSIDVIPSLTHRSYVRRTMKCSGCSSSSSAGTESVGSPSSKLYPYHSEHAPSASWNSTSRTRGGLYTHTHTRTHRSISSWLLNNRETAN